RNRTAGGPTSPSGLARAFGQRGPSGVDRLDDRIDVIDAATPYPTADGLKGRPEARVVGQIGVRLQIVAQRSGGQHAGGLLGREASALFADKVQRAVETAAIDHDLDQVAVAELAYRSAGERFGRHVT